METKRQIDADTLLQELVDTLAQCEGEFIAEIANAIQSNKVEYIGDSMFEITLKD